MHLIKHNSLTSHLLVEEVVIFTNTYVVIAVLIDGEGKRAWA